MRKVKDLDIFCLDSDQIKTVNQKGSIATRQSHIPRLDYWESTHDVWTAAVTRATKPILEYACAKHPVRLLSATARDFPSAYCLGHGARHHFDWRAQSRAASCRQSILILALPAVLAEHQSARDKAEFAWTRHHDVDGRDPGGCGLWLSHLYPLSGAVADTREVLWIDQGFGHPRSPPVGPVNRWVRGARPTLVHGS